MQFRGRAIAASSDLVAQIVAVDRHACGLTVVLTDQRLDDARVIWSAARLANRRSRSRQRRVLLVRRPGRVDITLTTDVVVAWLPADIRFGDVIVLPSRLLTSPQFSSRGPTDDASGSARFRATPRE
jgi:hypothetical protein